MRNKIIYILSSFLLFICLSVIYSDAEAPEQASVPQDNKAEVSLPTSEAQDKKTEVSPQVDLDFKDADIRDVARALSHISGKNIIVSDDIKVKVSLRVKDMDWREALEMILGAYNIAMLEEKNYIVITTLEKRRLAEERGDLQTRVLSLNFVDAVAIQKTLSSMLTQRGRIETDTRTNSLVITDIPERIDKIQDIALKLDTKTPQVVIEAMMLNLRLVNKDQLGIRWEVEHKTRPERSFTQFLSEIESAAGEIRYGRTLLPWANFNALVKFWKQEGRLDILANPRVLTLDNLIAAIDLVEQIPYEQQTTTDQGTVKSTQFKEAGVRLYVKPHITKDGHIVMNIRTEQSFRSGWTQSEPPQPIIDSRKAETTLMVKDTETIAIGGLRQKQNATTIDKIPLLGDIPLLGSLFRRKMKELVDTELLIFVTPYIVTETKLSEDEIKHLDRFKEIRGKEKSLSLKQATPFPLRAPTEAINK